MNLNRSIVVPITALVMFGLGYCLAALLGLGWHTMPSWVRWGIPVALVLWYLFDAMQREKPQK